jgi:hypothetical protein
MKLRLLFVALLITSISIAQEITVAEPDFVGQIFFVDQNNETTDLETQTASIKTGKSVGRIVSGVGKVKMRVVVKGEHSDVKFKKSEKLNFIYNNGDNSILPTKVAGLVELIQRKKNREYLVASQSNVSGQTESNQLDWIKYKAKKYGESSYLITFKDLPVGEYGFFLGEEDSNDMFLFSVIE